MTAAPVGFPTLLQDFFQRRLVAERGASAHTIASYRDTFELLLGYAAQHTGHTPSALTLDDLDAPLILDFLDHLKTTRGNSARTRNLRLTAIRSFNSNRPSAQLLATPLADQPPGNASAPESSAPRRRGGRSQRNRQPLSGSVWLETHAEWQVAQRA